jgi:hypothetical protein
MVDRIRRRLSLTKIALNAFLRKAELLEKRRDRKSLQYLVSRFSSSEIQKAIDKAEVDDDTFNGMLDDILGDEELEATRGKTKEDVGFAAFDRAIGEMAKAEEFAASEEEPVKPVLAQQQEPQITKKPKTQIISAANMSKLDSSISIRIDKFNEYIFNNFIIFR